MIVCAHGNVDDFCAEHDMVIVERYDGAIDMYRGSCAVIVTDSEMPHHVYCSLKIEMLGRGVELLSTTHQDDELFGKLVYAYARKRGRSGRPRFGMDSMGRLSEHGRRVSRLVIELREHGCTLKEIAEHPEVRHLDGRSLGMTTIQQILKNRELYEGK